MKTLVRNFALALACVGAFTVAAQAADAKVGQPAPAFTVKGADGKQHSLSDFKGKFVVLEWSNKDCPFVKKWYSNKDMQKLQKEWTGKDVAWLTVVSSAPGKQGHVTAEEAVKLSSENGVAATAILLDEDGKMGKAYGAKTTPHMFVVDKEGVLIYDGAIDDNNSPDAAAIAKSKNYVSAALTEAQAGKPVTTSTTKPYGCGVKY